MSEWLKKLDKQVQARIRERKGKLRAEYEELENNYRDFPWERTKKAMVRREEEIEELNEYSNRDNVARDYAEDVAMFKRVLGKVNALANNIEPADEKSDRNVKQLMIIVANYPCEDNEFIERAKKGIF